ncbi:glycosyltransferase family 4 protein [Flavobacterium branchiophilum]|uniref:Glycosyl transferase, group 1 family protein n=2 Tax=Flavobacterium branchiophilum TaxID=55197 RepID=G2Z7L4_FLABF|nr:glycosyltransferase family 4 protein [Flavobacterium branchiophilum]PDS23145.1 hypothetical protein B0A77_11560 [Flavobacterium branchiophilum]CCB69132.1 Glycosyl transferase, group 1 family protein [Flavobacterium branchiophilum FL-15]
MRVLIVCSGNAQVIAPFIVEQVNALKKLDVEIEYFLIKGKGILGYIKNYKALLQKIASFQPNIIHAHYGFSGLLSIFQRRIPVVVTFHGCDIQKRGVNNIISNFVFYLANSSIFVNSKMLNFVIFKKKHTIISCGIDLDEYQYISKEEARKNLRFSDKEKLVLFSSSFDEPVKNYDLAKKAVEKLENIKLLELKGYKREEVIQLMHAVDCLLITSIRETGPQVVKEALMCGCPIISVDVGDVKSLIEQVAGCFIVPYDENIIAEKISLVFQNNNRIKGREVIIEKELYNSVIAKKIKDIYTQILNK